MIVTDCNGKPLRVGHVVKLVNHMLKCPFTITHIKEDGEIWVSGGDHHGSGFGRYVRKLEPEELI